MVEENISIRQYNVRNWCTMIVDKCPYICQGATATEVGKKARELKLFDQVLLVTMSQTPNIRSIQEKMAKMLGLKMEEEDEEERAQRLWLRLKVEKRVLIIVDDVWSNFSLKDIGVEFNESNKGHHKVLLTTRRQHVCSLMDCEWKIPLGLLSEEEARKLFRMVVAMHDQSSSNILESLAFEVARECKGLPIAIKAVASTLKGKLYDFQIHEWKVALQKLKNSKPIDVEENERDAFYCLRLSYDYLRDKGAELLFFMCAMFPEDYVIPVEDLIRYGFGLGVCGEFESFDLARSMMSASLSKLLDSCLLEETSNEWASSEEDFGIGYVKMHDVVRDLALWMASEENHTIKLNLLEDVYSSIGERDVKDCFTISLRDRKFQETDPQLDAPKVDILILKIEKPLHLSYTSIDGLKGLKVLAIINHFVNSISLLPQSIGSLSNLRTLRLYRLEIGDMSLIASLRRLEVLVLQYCHFKDVPHEIETLSKLKLLDLTHCGIEEKNSLKTIERCSQLEELYVSGVASTNFWQCCAQFATAPNLKRYKLENRRQFDFEYSAMEPFAMRMLCLESRGDLPMLRGCKNIVPNMEQVVGGLGDLTELSLESWFEIEYLIDTTSELSGSFQEKPMFDRLIKLKLKEMENLKELCHGASPLDFFKRLEELHINKCQQLHSIFPLQCNLCNLKILNICGGEYDVFKGSNCLAVCLFSMSVAQSLLRIEELTIKDCPELRHIIANISNFHPMFPSLKKLSVCNCPKLEFIFPISCVGQDGVVQLEKIEVIDAHKMKYVFVDYGYNLSHENKIQIMIPHLQVFNLKNLKNLLGICPDKYHTRWPSLRELRWINCPKLANLWINMEKGPSSHEKEVDHPKPLITKFQAPESSVICSSPTGTHTLSFQYLQSLKLSDFTALKSIFSMVVLRSLSELKLLSICNCDELVEIIVDDEEHADLTQVEVCLPKLEKLDIRWCSKLKSLFCLDIVIKEASVLPNLSRIQLEELPNFVDICRGLLIHKLKLREIIIVKCPRFVPILGATQVIPLHHGTEEKVTVWDITVNQLDRQEMLPLALQSFLNIEDLKFIESRVEGILQLQVGNENAGQGSLNSNIQSLYLRQLPELRFIWGGNITVLEFHRLNNKCPKLKTIFPSAIVGSLQSLQELWINECKELKEIIASSHLQQICFPKLEDINIYRCDKLNCIFSDYMPRHFPQLSYVEIEECCEIERIFGGTRVADEDDFLVLKLERLRLWRLPNFAEIGNGIQLRMRAGRCVADDCPKYTPIY